MSHPSKPTTSTASPDTEPSPSLPSENSIAIHHSVNEEETQHDPPFRRPDPGNQHHRRDRVPAAAGDLPGACRPADDEHARPNILAEPGRGHRLSVAPARRRQGRAGDIG